jgi:hypothetical protein
VIASQWQAQRFVNASSSAPAHWLLRCNESLISISVGWVAISEPEFYDTSRSSMEMRTKFELYLCYTALTSLETLPVDTTVVVDEIACEIAVRRLMCSDFQRP